MSPRLHRVVTALAAAALTVGGAVTVTAVARADAGAPAVVYVDAGGNDSQDCTNAARACATIAHALEVVAPDGVVRVAGGTYPDPVTITTGVTITKVDASPVITAPMTVDDAAASVSITGLTFTGSSGVVVDGNSGHTTVTGNAFDLAADTVAIALAADGLDPMAVTLGGNTGTVVAPTQPITQSGNVAITPTGTPNTITTSATSLTASSDAPTALITEQAPRPFSTTTSSDLDLTGARYDIALATTGDITAGDVVLDYSVPGGTTSTPVSLDQTPASLDPGDGIPNGGPVEVDFQISVASDTPAGSITLTMSVDQLDGTQVLNAVAGTSLVMTVRPNAAPTAQPQSVNVARNGSTPVTLAAVDPDGDAVTAWTIDTTGMLGQVTHDASADPNVFDYTAPARYSGTDSFTFTATDEYGNSSEHATVSVTIGADNVPVATDILVPTLMSHGPAGNTIDLSSGVTDTDGDSLDYSVQPISAGVTAGTVSVTGHSALYTPTAPAAGAHAFKYRAFDGTSYSSWAVVSFSVDSPPVAIAQSDLAVSHVSATPLPIPTLTASDADAAAGDVLTFSVPASGPDAPAHGTLDGTAPGGLTYTPGRGYAGPDDFTFTVTDSYGGVSTAKVTLNLTDQAPITSPGSTKIAAQPAAHTVDLTASDPDGDGVRYALVQPVPHNLTVNSATGVVTIPALDTGVGTFSFGYTATSNLSGSPASSPGTMQVVVNKPPVASARTFTTPYGTTVKGQLTASDADDDPMTYRLSGSGSAHQQPLTLMDSGSFTYTPRTTFAGTDSFTFQASDGWDWSTPATATIVVDRASSTMTVSLSLGRPTSADHETATVHVTSAGNESNGLVTIETGGFGKPTAKIKNGQAKITLPQFPGGSQSITAVFAGTQTVAPVKTSPLAFTVTKVAGKLTYKTNPAQLTTRTSNATATVTVTAGPFRPSGGTVTIDENGRRIASGTPRVGVITLKLPRFSLGQHNLTIGYTGTPSITAASMNEIERVGAG